MTDNKIRLPSGQGGLTRYSEELGSKWELSPGTVLILSILIIILIIILHWLGESILS